MKVYKYRGVEEGIIERDLTSFRKNQFFAPNIEKLNDPFEANFNEEITEAIASIGNLLSRETSSLQGQLKDLLASKDDIGIYSLSKTNVGESMWAYYASSHKGYCIEYQLESLEDKYFNSDFMYRLVVEYSNKIPRLGIDDVGKKSFVDKMFGKKKKSWDHEAEVRLIFNKFGLKCHHESAITGLFLGYKIEPKHESRILETFSERNISIYKMEPDKSKHGLTFNLLEQRTKAAKADISLFKYRVMDTIHNPQVSTYFVHLISKIDEKKAIDFITAFRTKHCTRPSNIHLFKDSKAKELFRKYPLNDAESKLWNESQILYSDFTEGNDK